jgi:phosphoribosyl-ATP pyrophosphohydrolase
MIIPSIDIMGGRAVQLRQGREFVLDGGDPLERLEQFAVVGEVAVVDLDAALGRGSNKTLIEQMVRTHPCRVGGGIRDLETARAWLDAGAERVVIGTAASAEFCGALPRDRVIAAVDSVRGEVVVQGWRTKTGESVLDAVRRLAPFAGGLLLTQVEHEGQMRGFDLELVCAAVGAAGNSRVTAAGGITTAEDVAALDHVGADAQIGMAIYTQTLDLGDAFAAPLLGGTDTLWPTIVADPGGRVLGLVWSSRDSLRRAVAERRGIYWSRSRNALWVKGESSGNSQQLVAVRTDCDRDALLFIVRQEGDGFCHTGAWSCFGDRFDLSALERVIARRAAGGDPSSRTARLLAEPGLLEAKLQEECGELLRAVKPTDVVHEAADVMYFLLVALARAGANLSDVEAELRRRSKAVSRRPMEAKP